jgi:hypothetical protein
MSSQGSAAIVGIIAGLVSFVVPGCLEVLLMKLLSGQRPGRGRSAMPHHKVCDAASPRLQPAPCCVATALASATAVMYVFG